MTTEQESTAVYNDLDSENEGNIMKIESLCMSCRKNGLTQLLCTRIPFYKQVIIMSFKCEHCGFRNSELQSGEAVQEFGSEIVLSVKDKADLNRTIVKSEYAALAVPELELEIPFKSQVGEITTIEGILMRVKYGLLQDQELRRKQDPRAGKKIDEFLIKLDDCLQLKMPWTLKLNDPSGNCFIENPDPFHVDPRCICSHYYRDLAANKLLALADDDQVDVWKPTDDEREWKSYEDCKNTILHFLSPCPDCGVELEVLMKPTDIPHFQTVIVMSSTCDKCGYRSNEVKPGGAIQEMGSKMSICVKEEIDLARDVLKSDTCYMEIPELEIEVGPGALSGRFTTVEGLLIATKDQLKLQSAFFFGDSAQSDTKSKLKAIFDGLDEILALKRVATLILNDPGGNSYIQSISDDAEDPRLTKEFYMRDHQQNEELGLNDMKTENYEELEVVKEEPEDEEKNAMDSC